MRKRITLVAITVAAALMLASCGGKKPATTQADTTAPDTTEEATTGDDGNDTTEAGGDDTTTEASAPSGDYTDSIDLTLLKLGYNSADGWTYEEEDDISDSETYGSVKLKIMDGDDEKLSVTTTVKVTDCYSFRDDIEKAGFDQYEYEVNKSYPLEKVGNFECLRVDSEDGRTVKYYGRDEAANATLTVYVYSHDGTDADKGVELLKGLETKAPDVGNEDGPWYWEGTPFEGKSESVMVGTNTIETKWIPFAEWEKMADTFDNYVGVVGENVYILEDETLKKFDYDGEKLTFNTEVDAGDKAQRLVADANGKLHISGFGGKYRIMENDTITASYDDVSYFAPAPSGDWGISYFTKPECTKITYSGGAGTPSDITFAELSLINRIFIDDSYIYVCGSAADESGHKVFIYDHDGNLKLTLADDDGSSLGSMTYMAQFDGGFIGLDGNMREVVLWNTDGTYIGSADDGDLFGTKYPWFCSTQKLSDGSFFTIMTDERQDRSADELTAFIITVK